MSDSLKIPFSVRTKTGILTTVVVLSILIITLAGCATLRNKRAVNMEEVLYKAGFQMKPADTPEKLAHLKTLPQRKIIPHVRKGIPRYAYADAEGCQCLYLGDRDAFQSFQHILLEKEVAEHEYVAGENVEYVEIDWDMWGDFTEVVVE
jgi:hypothetical protein